MHLPTLLWAMTATAALGLTAAGGYALWHAEQDREDPIAAGQRMEVDLTTGEVTANPMAFQKPGTDHAPAEETPEASPATTDTEPQDGEPQDGEPSDPEPGQTDSPADKPTAEAAVAPASESVAEPGQEAAAAPRLTLNKGAARAAANRAAAGSSRSAASGAGPEDEGMGESVAGAASATTAAAPQAFIVPEFPDDGIRLKSAPAPLVSETAQDGILPRRADNGTTVWQYYGRPFARNAVPSGTAIVSILLTDAGLQESLTAEMLRLPGAVSLAVSPYAAAPGAVLTRVRDTGHEVWLHLPVEPEQFPASDPGPLAILSTRSADANLGNLRRLLTLGTGYVGLVLPRDDAVSVDPRTMRPVLNALAARGVAVVHSKPEEAKEFEQSARAARTAHVTAAVVLDLIPTEQAVTAQLEALSQQAREQGSALGVGSAYPATLRALAAWLPTLEARQLALAPASALVQER